MPKREPSRVVQQGCILKIYPDTSAGYIQQIDLSGAVFAQDSFVWYGDGDVGNAIIVFEATETGRIRWSKPGQDSSPFPYAVLQTARYVHKADVFKVLNAVEDAISECSIP